MIEHPSQRQTERQITLPYHNHWWYKSLKHHQTTEQHHCKRTLQSP